MRIKALGKKVRIEGKEIIVDGEKYNISAVRELWVDQNSGLTPMDMMKLAKARIVVYIFDNTGLIGVMLPMRTSYGVWIGEITLEQARIIGTEKAKNIAREIVDATIHNIYVTSHKYVGRRIDKETKTEFNREIRRAKYCMKTQKDNYMICEARAWRALYRAIRKICPTFKGRIRRPPGDPFNAIYSYMNSLLYAHCLHVTIRAGLDPSLSFVHAPSLRRRFSLPLDIKDIFAPYVSIRLGVKLYKRLTKDPERYFRKTEKKSRIAWYLSPVGRKIVVRAFRSCLRRQINHDGQKITLERAIVMEAKKLRRAMLEEDYEYRAWRM